MKILKVAGFRAAISVLVTTGAISFFAKRDKADAILQAPVAASPDRTEAVPEKILPQRDYLSAVVGDIELGKTYWVRVDDPDAPGGTRDISMRFPVDEPVLYFGDEKGNEVPHELISLAKVIGSPSLAKVIGIVRDAEGITTITAQKVTDAPPSEKLIKVLQGSSDWTDEEIAHLCKTLVVDKKPLEPFPIKSTLANKAKIIPKVQLADGALTQK